MEKTASVIAQYVRNLYATSFVRPYENKHPLTNSIGGGLSFEKLPEDGHYRVSLTLSVHGTNSEGVPCFEVGCSLEAIVFVTGLTEEEISTVLTHNIATLLVGNIRSYLTTASLNTGYGPVTLPPMHQDQLDALAAAGQREGVGDASAAE